MLFLEYSPISTWRISFFQWVAYINTFSVNAGHFWNVGKNEISDFLGRFRYIAWPFMFHNFHIPNVKSNMEKISFPYRSNLSNFWKNRSKIAYKKWNYLVINCTWLKIVIQIEIQNLLRNWLVGNGSSVGDACVKTGLVGCLPCWSFIVITCMASRRDASYFSGKEIENT